MQELNDLIAFLESTIPANPESPKSKKMAGQLEDDLKDYFKKLEDAVPMGKLEKVYNKYVEQ
jgi:hypothetical protein